MKGTSVPRMLLLPLVSQQTSGCLFIPTNKNNWTKKLTKLKQVPRTVNIRLAVTHAAIFKWTFQKVAQSRNWSAGRTCHAWRCHLWQDCLLRLDNNLTMWWYKQKSMNAVRLCHCTTRNSRHVPALHLTEMHTKFEQVHISLPGAQ